MDNKPSTYNILRRYYTKVLRMDEYIKDKVSEARHAKLLRASRENDDLKRLVEGTYVCVNPKLHLVEEDDGLDYPSILSSGDGATQSETVHRVLSVLLSRRGTSGNVLCQGYLKSEQGFPNQATSALGPGIINVYPSNRVGELKSARWVALFNCLGEEHMIEMLLKTSIFVGSKNDYYTQLTGESLVDLPLLPQAMYSNNTNASIAGKTNLKASLKRKRTLKSQRDPRKKQKISTPSAKDDFPKSPNAILFARSRMFYARAARSLRGKVIFGLRKEHVLNRYQNHHDQDEAKHILKYIFPRQFGLHSVFTHATDRRETTHAFKDYTDREAEIASGIQDRDPKVYRRLGPRLLPLIAKLQKLHKECSYHALIEYYCGQKDEDSGQIEVDVSFGSEDHSKEYTQKEISIISTKPPDTERPVSTAGEGDIIRHHTPQHKIVAFVFAVVKRVIPKDFFGSEHNLSVILKGVEMMIRVRRFENISLHSVMSGLRVTDVEWLAPPNTPIENKLSQTDFQKRTELLAEFVYWFFDSFIIHLIRTNFYATETAVYKNRVFYFRHDVWRQISLPSISKLQETMLVNIPKTEARSILSRRSMGYSFVRFLPKQSGVRCITNLRRRAYKMDPEGSKNSKYAKLGPSINSILRPVFSILNLEKSRNPAHVGNALFSSTDMYVKLKDYQQMRLNKGWTYRPLYFARVDIKSCFDTIEQPKLLDIISRVVKCDEYMLHRYCEMNMNQGKVRRRFDVRASAADDLRFAGELGKEVVKTTFHRVVVENVVPQFITRDDALELLEEHVTNNLLKMGKQFYRQKVGIPQGSVLSTVLCNIFYADLERRRLPFLKDQDGLLLRLIDDFLFISMNKDHAKQFLQTMHDGHLEYGCSVNMAKSLTNFDVTINAEKVPRLQGSTYFPFCGNLIDTDTLDVFRDFTRLDGTCVRDSITTEQTQTPGRALIVKTLNALKLGGHAMYIDTKFNSLLTALANVYLNLTNTAMKMHNYIRALTTRPPEKLIRELIEQVFSLQYTLTRSHLKAWPGSMCAVTENQARRPRILDDALAEADGVWPDCRLVKRDRGKYKLRQVTTGYGEGSSKAFDFQAG